MMFFLGTLILGAILGGGAGVGVVIAGWIALYIFGLILSAYID